MAYFRVSPVSHLRWLQEGGRRKRSP